jgi:hypothetical protein
MSLTNRVLIIGSHALFARDGAAYTIDETACIVGRYNKPPVANPPTNPDPNWDELGIVASFQPNPSTDTVDVMAPSPYRFRLYEKINKGSSLKVSFTLEQINDLTFTALLFGGMPDPVTGQFVPLSNEFQVRGWLKLQYGDQQDVQRGVMDVYGILSAQAITLSNDTVKPQIDFDVLYSPLAVGTSYLQAVPVTPAA